MNSYYLYQRQYRQASGAWNNTSIYSVDGWGTQEKVVAQIDPSECDEWNTGCKVTLTLEDCTEVCIPCDGSRTVTRADLGEYANRAVIAEFGCCIDTIDGVFQGDTMIKKVIIPDCITAITEASFYGTKIQGIVFPASITNIGSQAHKLSGLKWARFMGTTPPNLGAYCSLGGNCPIYVPPAYVNVYKRATIWNQYANRIFPWNGQVETDYQIECDAPGPDTGETGTTYETWIEDETAFTCSDTTKYHVEYAWTSSTGSEGSYVKTDRTRTGDLWEYNSTDCGYEPPTPVYEIWIADETEFVCDGTTKYEKEYKWTSYTGDEGSYEKTDTFRQGSLLEENSADCGYVPPADFKLKMVVDGYNFPLIIECDGTSSYTRGDIYCEIGGSQQDFMTKIRSAIVGDCVTSVGGFGHISSQKGAEQMSSIVISNSVTTMTNGAFDTCYSLKRVDLPTGITAIPKGAFASCSGLVSVYMSENVTSIGDSAFYLCSHLSYINGGAYRQLVLPKGLTSIGGYAFAGTNIVSVDIPSGVTSIGGRAFAGNRHLKSVFVRATTPPTLKGGEHFDFSNQAPIYVPPASVDAYKASWGTYAGLIQPIPN